MNTLGNSKLENQKVKTMFVNLNDINNLLISDSVLIETKAKINALEKKQI